jgi:Transcription initiation factor TFIID subunit A
VTNFGCRLAKHRNGDTLEVRDLQLHLGALFAFPTSFSTLPPPPVTPCREGEETIAHSDLRFDHLPSSSTGLWWCVLTITDRTQPQHSYSWVRVGHATHRTFAGRGDTHLPDRTKCQKGRARRSKHTPCAPLGTSGTGQAGGQAHVETYLPHCPIALGVSYVY